MFNFIMSHPKTSLAVVAALVAAAIASSRKRELPRGSAPASLPPIHVECPCHSVRDDEFLPRERRRGWWKKLAGVASGFVIIEGVANVFNLFADAAPVVADAVCKIV